MGPGSPLQYGLLECLAAVQGTASSGDDVSVHRGSVIFAEHYFNVSLRAPRDCGVPVFDHMLLP